MTHQYSNRNMTDIVEVLHAEAGQLVCCDQSMELLAEKIEDNHYIEWIEVIADGVVYRV